MTNSAGSKRGSMNPSKHSKISRREIFGPVICVYEYDLGTIKIYSIKTILITARLTMNKRIAYRYPIPPGRTGRPDIPIRWCYRRIPDTFAIIATVLMPTILIVRSLCFRSPKPANVIIPRNKCWGLKSTAISRLIRLSSWKKQMALSPIRSTVGSC